MEFLIKFDTVKSGWTIVYIKGSQAIISKKYISFSEDWFFLADTDEMLHYATFHSKDLHCLLKYLIWCFWSSKR